MIMFFVVAIIAIWLMRPKITYIQVEDCTKHTWERNLENELYCSKCHRKPG